MRVSSECSSILLADRDLGNAMMPGFESQDAIRGIGSLP
ncbi:hypothetical protein [Salmonella phage S144]|uniref:Uncharacterized protein n=1 Tax=Salmonella phage S144 TaxID=2759179 RepID=A0A7G5CF37_9CAUD|nr:hypothetical protein [Salmonella phage S144]